MHNIYHLAFYLSVIALVRGVPVVETVQTRAFDTCTNGHIWGWTLRATCLNGQGGSLTESTINLSDCFVNQAGQLKVSHALHRVAKVAF